MKRYELAKKQGLNWQVILISDAETELKVLIRDLVLFGAALSIVNTKITQKIKETVDALDSEVLKEKVKSTFPQFSTKLYWEWIVAFGSKRMGETYLNALTKKGVYIPNTVKDVVKALPDASLMSYNRATANNTFPKAYEKSVQERIDKIAKMQAKEDYSSRYSLRASAEIQIRQEWHEKNLENLKEKGIELAWIDTHANCSERCEPWQGKLYSLSSKSGEIDGVKFQPLENATDIYEYTKAGKAYKNGCLSGFNCRHKLVPYKKGFRPIPIPENVMKKQREMERRQRELERRVRLYEAKASINKGINKKGYLAYKNLSKKWTEEYERYSKENNIPFYPSRLDI